MSELLFLSHRIPFPPDKGDKIRSWNLLKGLAREHTVHLGTFVDDVRDWQYLDDIKALCGETCVRPLDPRWARLRSVRALLNGAALSVEYYRDAVLREWVQEIIERRPIDRVYVYSSSVAQYALLGGTPRPIVRVHDPCDVDSDKWRQYASSRGGLMRWIYAREARTLAAAEREYTARFDATLVVSPLEAEVLAQIAPRHRARIHVVTNGVDTDYFDPALEFESPYPAGSDVIAFTGAMDYFANVDGVCWFAEEVFPAILRELPHALFAIVGSNPVADVRALAGRPGVLVTGRVPDVRPYLQHARLVVAPLRIARGVQNKVLEAMAMARPVVATSNALQGLPDAKEGGVVVADDTTSMAAAVGGLLKRAPSPRADLSRSLVRGRYSWETSVGRLEDLLMPGRAAA